MKKRYNDQKSIQSNSPFRLKTKGEKGKKHTHSDIDKSSRKTRMVNRILNSYCTTLQCSPLRRKFMECNIINPALTLLVIGQRQKAPNFSACHCSPHGSLVSIGQHFVTTRVVHLLKRTDTSLITKADLITESDQAVRAVHSCNSCFFKPMVILLP